MSINGLPSISSAAAGGVRPAGGADARSAASETIDAIGERVQAWAASLAPGGARATGGFRTDPTVLARGGDVYGLHGIAGDLARRFGATPTQEGDLRRALEGVTRGAMVEAGGLHGAPDGVRTAGLDAARSAAAEASASEGIDGVTARLEAAAGAFAARAAR